MDTSRIRKNINVHKKKYKIGHRLSELQPISVTKPKSMEKIDNYYETFYSVNNAVTIVTLVRTSNSSGQHVNIIFVVITFNQNK